MKSPSMLRSAITVGAVVGLLVSLLIWTPRVVRADNAPFWESPVGLTPGSPDSQVRMAAETVNIEVVERGDDVFAVVNASFDMHNQGPMIQMKVGFPSSTLDVIGDVGTERSSGDQRPFSPVTFTPVKLHNFRVWTDATEFQVAQTKITTGSYGSDWLIWEMSYPSNEPVTVHVSYEQLLGTIKGDSWERPYFQPMYVLRTGALWDGTIGEATITMSAPDGGALLGGPGLFSSRTELGDILTTPSVSAILGADGATEASPSRIVWQLRDFEPTQDVGSTYVVAAAWRPLRDAEAALSADAASADDYLRAAQAALRLISTKERWNGPYGIPQVLVSRYSTRARAWAEQATALDPGSAAAWEALGEVERWFAMPTMKNHGELACWPSRGEAAYRRAIALGSPTAAIRLDDLFEAIDWRMFQRQSQLLPGCDGSIDSMLPIRAVRSEVIAGNRAWANGVLQGSSDEYWRHYEDRWLRLLTDEVSELRQLGHYRIANLQELTFQSVALTGPDAAVAETTEVWDDKTYDAGHSLIRDASGRLTQRYELRLRDGTWKIIDATLTRETPP